MCFFSGGKWIGWVLVFEYWSVFGMIYLKRIRRKKEKYVKVIGYLSSWDKEELKFIIK